MSKTVLLLVGPPAAGKTTYCKDKLANYHRISQDEMGRHEHFTNYLEALKKKHYIVVDRTNFDKTQRNKYLEAARLEGFRTKILIFEVDYKTCMERALAREGHPSVKTPKDARYALGAYFKNFQRPTPEEADEIAIVNSGSQ